MQIIVETGEWNDNNCVNSYAGSICRGGSFPPSPPTERVPLQSRLFGHVRFVFSPRQSGGSLLTAVGLATMARLESAAADILHEYCLREDWPGDDDGGGDGDDVPRLRSKRASSHRRGRC